MVETLCTSGAVKHRAGANASETVTASGAWLTELINQAEGEIAAETQCDWVASYSGLSANYKKILEGACAAKAAIKVISYDSTGFLNIGEAAFMVNVLWGEYDRSLKLLSDSTIRNALGGTQLG